MSESTPLSQQGVSQQRLSELAAAISDTPAPIYQRVKQAIVGQIRDGVWKPHQRVPSESELVNELGVSRMTINRALRELTNEGFFDAHARRWHLRRRGQSLYADAGSA